MTTQQMLDKRYGRDHAGQSRIIAWAVGGGIAVAVVLLFAWMTLSDSANGVEVDSTSLSVDNPREMTLTFQVTAPPGSTLACAIEAQDEQHAIVGWRIAKYPASDARTRAFTESVPIIAPATTGLVNSCWVT